MQPYSPYIPKTVGEIWDQLGSMMLSAPIFRDTLGYFPGQNIETEFFALNEGLKMIRKKIGEEGYRQLIGLSDQMKTYFLADPEDKTGDTSKGRACILEMENLLKSLARRKRSQPAKSDDSSLPQQPMQK